MVVGGEAEGGRRVSREEGLRVAQAVIDKLRDHSERVEIAGSLRRQKSTIGDVDLVVLPRDKERVLQFLKETFGLQQNGEPKRKGLIDGVQVDIYLATEDDFGTQMMMWTGSKNWNIVQRMKAKRKGLKLNEYGLWAGSERIAGKNEEEVYKALGETFRKPYERER